MQWGFLFLCQTLALAIVIFSLKRLCQAIPPPDSHTGHGKPTTTIWSRQRKLQFRESTRRLWHHGFDSYMANAFPLDELHPISCSGQGPDWLNPAAIHFNDVLANVSVTLIDVLDTFVVMNNHTGFRYAVQTVIDNVSFDVDTKPQVFEITIRVLGGLLSAHIFAEDPRYGFQIEGYKGELLQLAIDLGTRLLPAFDTPTGIPYARVNLRHGMMSNETVNTCTAGAGSLILEFAVLSRLTSDERYEAAARKAFFAIWNRRSDLGLVGNGVNVMTGTWNSPTTSGIGAGIDSFFEYALKMYVLSGEAAYLDVFEEAYAKVMKYCLGNEGYWFRMVSIWSGETATTYVDSLSAFWSGLQVLAGDLENAIKSHLVYWNLWLRFAGLPETYDVVTGQPISPGYPLRPEFIESTYFLYRATHDTFYLDVGERVYHDLVARANTTCGLATVSHLLKGTNEDRMESFVLSETLKYLYLLFDEDNRFHSDESDFIFSTEGHLLTIPPSLLQPPSRIRKELRGIETHECASYSNYNSNSSKLTSGIPDRPDFEYPRYLIRSKSNGGGDDLPTNNRLSMWSPDGWCEMPKIQQFILEYIMSPSGGEAEEDIDPGSHKLRPVSDGVLLWDATGIRLRIRSRQDGRGYDVIQLGPHRVLSDQKVYVADPAILRLIDRHHHPVLSYERDMEVFVRFSVWPPRSSHNETLSGDTELSLVAGTALFGGHPTLEPTLRFGKGAPPLRVKNITVNPEGCDPYLNDPRLKDTILLVIRGICPFMEKLRQAKLAGASGVLVINNNGDGLLNPTADHDAQDELGDVVLLTLGQREGDTLINMIGEVEATGVGDVVVQIVDAHAAPGGQVTLNTPTYSGSNLLYVDSHPLLNTVLLR